jgi:hypothetical protein
VRRVLTSRQFAHADTLKRILTFLVDRFCEAGAAPKEYEIAVQAMGRPASFDPRTDPIVRVSVGSIRDRLEAFFATEGADEALRLEIPRGQYRAVFTERKAAPERTLPASLKEFWGPYFRGEAANVIVYTEPLFFRDDAGRYFRDWSVNTVEAGVSAVQDRFPGANEISPAFHYLSAGEVHCLLSLTRMFHEADAPVETRNSRNASWHELSQSNLILLGSPRTNQFLDALQGDYPLLVRADRIEDAQSGERFQGLRYKDGRLGRMSEYAVVTRRPGLREGCQVTMIAANHGRAIEGAGHALTLEDRVAEIVPALAGKKGRTPDAFQLLMKVDTVDVDDEVTSVACIRHYALPPG